MHVDLYHIGSDRSSLIAKSCRRSLQQCELGTYSSLATITTVGVRMPCKSSQGFTSSQGRTGSQLVREVSVWTSRIKAGRGDERIRQKYGFPAATIDCRTVPSTDNVFNIAGHVPILAPGTKEQLEQRLSAAERGGQRVPVAAIIWFAKGDIADYGKKISSRPDSNRGSTPIISRIEM